MTDTPSGFSVSFDLGDLGQPVAEVAERVAFHEGEAMPLSSTDSLWVSLRNGKALSFPSRKASGRRACLRAQPDLVQQIGYGLRRQLPCLQDEPHIGFGAPSQQDRCLEYERLLPARRRCLDCASGGREQSMQQTKKNALSCPVRPHDYRDVRAGEVQGGNVDQPLIVDVECKVTHPNEAR